MKKNKKINIEMKFLTFLGDWFQNRREETKFYLFYSQPEST